MAEGARDEVRYTAFLSYSHKDAAAAGKLHRRLESYRLPRRLAGTQTPRGAVPNRLWPIFRDRDELPAASDLSETVRTALAQSGALIILCSPHAAQSLWVAEEIATFRTLHPDRPILAAILDGDPPDCFPAALRAFGQDGTWHEPLATDLRPQADGAHLGLLKLVAGITGVGLDELVQRDAARRIRRVMVVTGAALVAMLIMAALAVVALNARAEAERQRTEAEGLVEFMLTDLRERLRGVGNIDVMQAVNERALNYYGAGRDLSDWSRESLLRRSRILQAIGEDELTSGNMRAAATAIHEAHRITAEQLTRAANDNQTLFVHSQSEYLVGRIAELRRDWPAAARQYQVFADTTDRLIAVAPTNPDFMMRAGWSGVDLGNIQMNHARDYPAAEQSYRRAIFWFGRAAAVRPRDEDAPRALANAYGWLADSFFFRSQWRESLNARRRQYDIVEQQYRANPRNAQSRFRFALAQRGIARSLYRVGRADHAREQLFSAYRHANGLAHGDRNNADWILFRALVGCDLYYIGLGYPDRLNRSSLRDEIRTARAALTAQGNPRAAELSNCVNSMRRSRGT